VIATEFGYWANLDGGLAGDQTKFFTEAMRSFAERPYVAGAVWWTAFDYYTFHSGVSTFGAYGLDRKSERPLAERMRKAYGGKAP
jgi:hypothetical protein